MRRLEAAEYSVGATPTALARFVRASVVALLHGGDPPGFYVPIPGGVPPIGTQGSLWPSKREAHCTAWLRVVWSDTKRRCVHDSSDRMPAAM